MNRSSSLVAAVLVSGLLVGVAAGDKVQWKKADGGNDHWYEVVAAPNGIAFADAQAAAEKKGGHLATISSEKENKFVFKLVDDAKYWGTDGYNGYGPWLGAHQNSEATEPAKGWEWVTGEPWKYESWSPGAGEPNDGDGVEDHGEDFMHFFCYGSTDREARWNDSGEFSGAIVGYAIEWTPKEELPAKQAADKPAAAPPAATSTEPTESTDADDASESSDAG